MLKRLSFALVAVSFAVPVVACLNGASEEATAGDANMLTDAEKASCNFGFAETNQDSDPDAGTGLEPVVTSIDSKGVASKSRPFVWGDTDGDHNIDILTVSGTGEVAYFPGKGNGHFGDVVKTTLPLPAGGSASAVAPVAIGDFDGDGKKDLVVIQTVVITTPLGHKEGRYLIGYGKDDGTLDFVDQEIKLKDGEGSRKAKWNVVADLDHDGKDDLLAGGGDTESVYFGGEATRKLKRGTTGLTASTIPTEDRILAFASKDALVVNTRFNSFKLTFAADRTPTVVNTAITPALPTSPMVAPTDLDGDDRPELAFFSTASADKSLTITPLGDQAPAATKFVQFPGSSVDNLDFALDLAHDQKRELIFKTDARKLYAVCGYSSTTKEIVAAELPVAYGDKTVLVGTPDLDNDGKPDFATFNFDTKVFKVWLGTAPPAAAPPQISYFADGFVPATDAGTATDAATDLDSGVVVIDTDGGTTADSGVVTPPDAGTTPKPDAGTVVTPPDAGTTHPPTDAGTTHPPTDAGTVHPGGDDDDTTGDDDDDDDGPAKPDAGGKKPTPKPSTSSSSGSTSGSFTVTVKEKPKDDDGGCSTAPGPTSPAGSIALGAMVALFLAGSRRRRQR